ncbi:hypothetical protein FRC11_003751, partial [Ceratobasidium sp. 423]
EQLSVIHTKVTQMEQEHGINPCWTPECQEWKAAVEHETSKEYHKVLCNLELLVVQQL